MLTFLMTDVEGSTRAWEEQPAAMAEALALHDDVIATAISAAGGHLIKRRGEGDATFSVFEKASDAAPRR